MVWPLEPAEAEEPVKNPLLRTSGKTLCGSELLIILTRPNKSWTPAGTGLAPDALERAELSLNVGRAERTRKERETKLNTERQAKLLFDNRREKLQAIAETGLDDGSMEKRFTALDRDDLAKSWRKERNAAIKLHSFFRETDGAPLLEQAQQLGKKFKSGANSMALPRTSPWILP